MVQGGERSNINSQGDDMSRGEWSRGRKVQNKWSGEQPVRGNSPEGELSGMNGQGDDLSRGEWSRGRTVRSFVVRGENCLDPGNFMSNSHLFKLTDKCSQ